MPRQASVINLDPIDRKKRIGFFGKLLITTYHGGKPVHKTEPYGHYMFCGKQRSGKTASVIWYAERLAKRYKKRKISYTSHELCDANHENCKLVKFDTPPKVKLWSNFIEGTRQFNKNDLFDIIDRLDPYANEVRIFLVDEFHTYYPKGSVSSKDKEMLANMTTVFSQLAKRNAYVLSTAQVYGRLEKALREQCLYMVDCKVRFNGKIENQFIIESEILCDELGRWAGNPRFIKVHGLAEMSYDTKRLVRS